VPDSVHRAAALRISVTLRELAARFVKLGKVAKAQVGSRGPAMRVRLGRETGTAREGGAQRCALGGHRGAPEGRQRAGGVRLRRPRRRANPEPIAWEQGQEQTNAEGTRRPPGRPRVLGGAYRVHTRREIYRKLQGERNDKILILLVSPLGLEPRTT
jgi:hypothetical protein